jgi:hypothetical protein
MDYHGACMSFTSSDERIEILRKAAAEHGKHLAWGKCAEAPVHCENSHGYKICASHEGVDVSDIIELDSIHAFHHEDAMMPPVLLPKSQSFHTLLLLTISMSIRANALMPLTAEHGEAFMSADLLDTEHGVVTKWSTPSKRDTASN